MTENQEQKADYKITIQGGCHCGAIRFQALVPTNTVILECNCSVCSMTGFRHLIVSHQNFELIQGDNLLTNYQFNTKQASHLFCSRCGIKSFYQPRSHPDCWSINSNCIDDFDDKQWTFELFDGKNWQQAKQKLNQ
jgi:hypothetical protein